MRWVGIGIGALALLAGIILYTLLNSYSDPAVDPAWAVEGTPNPPMGSVTARWTGTSTLVFSDGETTLIIDGWFSRPHPFFVLFGTIAPDLEAIEDGLARNGITDAAMVIPVHSHYDHAMDSPEVARRTGALLVGSEATAQIGRGWGLPEDRIRVVGDGNRIRRRAGAAAEPMPDVPRYRPRHVDALRPPLG